VRILLTTYKFPDDRQAFMEEYVLALLALGIEVCVVASAGRDPAPNLRADAGGSSLEIVHASWTESRHKKLVTLLTSMGRAARHHRAELGKLMVALHRRHGFGRALLGRLYVLTPILSRPFDVVHLGWLNAAAQWPDLLSAVEAPLVVSGHGSDLRIDPLLGDRYRDPLQAVFERADLVHCVSDDLARHAIELGLEPSKVFVHPWGVDTAFFRPAPERGARLPKSSRASRTLRVVSVGRLHWVKGYEFALQALAQVRDAGVEFEYTIVGSSDDKELLNVLATVRDLDLDPQVCIRGTLSRHEVVEALQAADVFLLASLSEGLSTAALEAMAVGLPVVVTDVGGMREAVTDGVEGRVVPPRDPAALAAALLELAADERLRAAMGERGRRRASKDFDSGLGAAAMVEQYRRLVRERPGARARAARS
jgi:colanic acid/amylovoran biosynthesis glycosyltransferase